VDDEAIGYSVRLSLSIAPLCINTCGHLKEFVKNCVIQKGGKIICIYVAQNVDGKILWVETRGGQMPPLIAHLLCLIP